MHTESKAHSTWEKKFEEIVMGAGLINMVKRFMSIGEATTEGFNPDQACLYMGLQLEELAEKLEAVSTGCVELHRRSDLTLMATQLRQLGMEFKAKLHRGDIMRADREALLDADIDLAWVSVGAALSTSTNAPGAFMAVARANLAKFPGGVVTRDENGKITKPKGWTSPDLSPFVSVPDRD